MAETDDAPPTGDVMGNLPSTRPGRRSSRREHAGSAPSPSGRKPAKKRPAAKPRAKAATGPKAPPAKAATAADPPVRRRATASVKRAPAAPPVPPAPRSGWATPAPPEDDTATGLGVGAVVGEAVRQGERLVRGVLRRLG